MNETIINKLQNLISNNQSIAQKSLERLMTASSKLPQLDAEDIISLVAQAKENGITITEVAPLSYYNMISDDIKIATDTPPLFAPNQKKEFYDLGQTNAEELDIESRFYTLKSDKITFQAYLDLKNLVRINYPHIKIVDTTKSAFYEHTAQIHIAKSLNIPEKINFLIQSLSKSLIYENNADQYGQYYNDQGYRDIASALVANSILSRFSLQPIPLQNLQNYTYDIENILDLALKTQATFYQKSNLNLFLENEIKNPSQTYQQNPDSPKWEDFKLTDEEADKIAQETKEISNTLRASIVTQNPTQVLSSLGIPISKESDSAINIDTSYSDGMSLKINNEGVWIYKRWTRDEGGDIIKLVQNETNRTYPEALEYCSDQI